MDQGKNVSSFKFPNNFEVCNQVCLICQQYPAVPLLTSSNVCFPVNRPIAAICDRDEHAKLFVIGSIKIFHDIYFAKENNQQLADAVIDLALSR